MSWGWPAASKPSGVTPSREKRPSCEHRGPEPPRKDYSLRDRVRYTFIALSAKVFEAAFWCYEQLKGQQRKRA